MNRETPGPEGADRDDEALKPAGAGAWAPLVFGQHIAEAGEFLDEHPGPVELAPDHPLTPRLAFVLAQRGRTEEAIVLAASLRILDLEVADPGDRTQVQHLADVAGARIWVSWLEQRTDDLAVAVARQLLANDAAYPLEPSRRATLRYSLGAALTYGPGAGDPRVLDECATHLGAARSQATMLGYLPLEVACLSRLALLRVPSGDLETARRLSSAALAKGASLGDDVGPSTTAGYWRFIASAVEQWARYFQGLPMTGETVAFIEDSMLRFSFDPVASTVAGTVLALDHARSGRVTQARSALNYVLGDRRFADIGTWRLRPLVTDAYLAIARGDDSRARERVVDLTQAGAPGEALLIRATQLIASGENSAALSSLGGLTRGQVRTAGLTFPVACALEAMLLEQSGQATRADQSMHQALGAAEPYGAKRIFAMHDLPVMMRLCQRAVAARHRDRWAREILEFLEAELAQDDGPATIEVQRQVGGTNESDESQVASSPGSTIPASPSPLTERERQVLALVNAGASQAQMARELYVSLNTIKTHLRSIRQKLGVERTGEAAAVARSAGWLEP